MTRRSAARRPEVASRIRRRFVEHGVAHFSSKAALREHIDAYIAHWNDDPTPFIWTKPAASIIRSWKRMLDRISHAVHQAITDGQKRRRAQAEKAGETAGEAETNAGPAGGVWPGETEATNLPGLRWRTD
jgi:hypothetical protein